MTIESIEEIHRHAVELLPLRYISAEELDEFTTAELHQAAQNLRAGAHSLVVAATRFEKEKRRRDHVR